MSLKHIEECQALAEAAGWHGDALARLVVHPKSGTLPGFKAQLAQANEIRAVIRLTRPSIEAAGQDADGAAEHFVARGFTLEQVRKDTAALMAEHDEATAISTSRPLSMATGDPYAARAAEIDARKGPRG